MGKREGGRGGGRGGWRQKQPRRAIVWIHPEKAEVELSSGTLMDETESGTVGEHFLGGGGMGGAAAAGRETSRGGKVRVTVPLPLARRSLPLHSMWGWHTTDRVPPHSQAGSQRSGWSGLAGSLGIGPSPSSPGEKNEQVSGSLLPGH